MPECTFAGKDISPFLATMAVLESQKKVTVDVDRYSIFGVSCFSLSFLFIIF